MHLGGSVNGHKFNWWSRWWKTSTRFVVTAVIVFYKKCTFDFYKWLCLSFFLKPYRFASLLYCFFSFRYTSKPDAVYAILLEWPLTDELTLGAPISTSGTHVTMLGYEGEFNWKPATDKGGITVTFPGFRMSKLPCQWAWALKLENVK